MKKSYWVSLWYATYVVIVQEDKVVDVPPIASWMIGKSFSKYVASWLVSKGAKVIQIPNEKENNTEGTN